MTNRRAVTALVIGASMVLSACGGGGSDGGYGGGSNNGPVPPGDTTAPTVSSASPASNTESVAVSAAISATFSEAMDSHSITTSTFTVSSGGAPVAGAVSYSGATATFTPTSSLAANTTYTATITTGAKDPAGNPLAATYSWSFTTGIWNRTFVTSVSGNGNLSSWADAGANTGMAAADAVCQARAMAGGLSGTFKAWLSDDNDDAYCRIHNLTGKRSASCGQGVLPASAGPWVRTDGFPFSAPITELLNNGQVYAPVRFDEFGARVTEGAYFTGTYIDGSRHPTFPLPCTNWTSSSASVIGSGGDTETTSYNWTTSFGASCAATNIRLLCMQTGAGPSLPSLATSGKKVFITSTTGTGNLGSWPDAGSNSGLAAGDAICRARATAAGLANADRFKAWLSSSTTDAKDRIVSDGPWMRLDGVPVAENKADLLDGSLFTSINLSETGSYHGNQNVWSGTTDSGVKSANNTCNDWTDGTSVYTGASGAAMYAGPGWSVSGSAFCSFSFSRLRCIED